jgi:hypothetical protein
MRAGAESKTMLSGGDGRRAKTGEGKKQNQRRRLHVIVPQSACAMNTRGSSRQSAATETVPPTRKRSKWQDAADGRRNKRPPAGEAAYSSRHVCSTATMQSRGMGGHSGKEEKGANPGPSSTSTPLFIARHAEE